jgi:hypothetical protein
MDSTSPEAISRPIPVRIPVSYRLNLIGQYLLGYINDVDSGKVGQGVHWKQKRYDFIWIRAAKKVDNVKVASMPDIINTASLFASDQLPADIFPNHPHVLSCGRYSLDLSPTSEAIWVVELESNDDAPLSGASAGYKPILLIPLDEYGNVLLKVKITHD